MGCHPSKFDVLLTAGVILAMAAAMPTNAMQSDGVPRAELERLKHEAQQARMDAEKALKRAQDAENAIQNLIDGQPQTSVTASNIPNCTEDKLKTLPHRIECFETPVANDRSKSKGLMAYAVDYDNELYLVGCLNGDPEKPGCGAAYAGVSFLRISQPVMSRLTVSKGSEAFEGSYTLPLRRWRRESEDGEKVRPVMSSLTVGFSAAFDPNDKSSGLLFRNGSFNDDTAGISLSYGQQYYHYLPIFGKENSIEARAKDLAQSLWEQCNKALKAEADIFGEPPTEKPDISADSSSGACEGANLLRWSFNPASKEAYKANVAAWNAAFWDPAKKAVPAYGWGVTSGISTRRFNHIDPAAFSPGIVLDPAFPRLLSTLSTKEPTGGGLFIEEQSKRTFTGELGVYGFGHLAVKSNSSIFADGFLARLDLNLARRWKIDAAEKDQEFCTFKAAAPGIGECKNFNIGGPEAYLAFEPSINLRTKFKFNGALPNVSRFIPSFAISPRLGWNSDSKAYKFDLPIYLAGAEKDDDLTGGIRFSTIWNDENDKNNGTVWSVFLSTAFSMDGSKK